MPVKRNDRENWAISLLRFETIALHIHKFGDYRSHDWIVEARDLLQPT